MQVKTILNRVTRYKSFVFGKVTWIENSVAPTIEVEILPRRNGLIICSGCEHGRPGFRFAQLQAVKETSDAPSHR